MLACWKVTRAPSDINLKLVVLLKGCKSSRSRELLAACATVDGTHLFFFTLGNMNFREADGMLCLFALPLLKK